MKFEIGMGLIPTVIDSIRANSFSDVFWKNINQDGKQLFVCILQVYSEKCRISIKNIGLTFY